jgi:hypothetical protein
MKNIVDNKETKFLNMDTFIKDKLPLLQRNFSNNFLKKNGSNSQKLKPLINRYEQIKSITNFNDMISLKKFAIKSPETNSKILDVNLDRHKTSFYEVFPFNELRYHEAGLRDRLSNSTSEKRRIGKADKLRNTFNERSYNILNERQQKIDNKNLNSPESFSIYPTDKDSSYNRINKVSYSCNLAKTNNSVSLENFVGQLNKLDINTGIGPNCSGIKIEKLKEIQNEVISNLNFKKSVNHHFLMKHKFPKNIKFNLNKILSKPVNRFRDLNFVQNGIKYFICLLSNSSSLKEIEQKIMTNYS